jgi:hypothetical protein
MTVLVQSPSEAHAQARCEPVRMAPYFVVKATPDTPNAQGQRYDFEHIDAAVDRLSGRPGIHAVVLPRLRGNQTRVAVAVNARRARLSSPAVGLWPGRLFIVEVVRP